MSVFRVVFGRAGDQPDGEDDLKRRQLMELAIINGTYRDTAAAAGANAALGPASLLTTVPVPISRESHFTFLISAPTSYVTIQGGPKKLTHFVLYALTSSNIDRFSNLFHCLNQENICNNTTTPQVRASLYYLVKCQCLKSNN